MLLVNEVKQLYLGNQGENLCREINIDCRAWLVGYPNGSYSIWHKRNGDAVPSPTGAAFDPETGVITWKPTNTDTYVAGEGEAEIRVTENGVVKKNRKIKTGVSPAVTGSGSTPLGSDWQDYLEAIEQAAGVAIIKNGQIKFAIDDNGHLIFSYTDDVPVAEEEEE